jgi:hypothetical protein
MNFKNIFKKIWQSAGIIALASVVFYLGAEAGFQAKYQLDLWKDYRAGEKFNQAIIDMFKADTYGGKTPEETYNLFVDALKKQDVDLAVKYFVLDEERRARYWTEFDNMKKEGKMADYGNKLPAWDKWEQIKDSYNDWENRATIERGQLVTEPIKVFDDAINQWVIIEPGIYGDSIIFGKNSNNIWKIESF